MYLLIITFISRKKIYINNMAITGPQSLIISFKNTLNKDFKIIDLGELKYILSIIVTWNYRNWLIYLNQSTYIHQILIWFSMQDANTVSMLLLVKYNLTLSQCPKTNNKKQAYKDYTESIHYLFLVSLLLFTTQIWSDIQFAVRLTA